MSVPFIIWTVTCVHIQWNLLLTDTLGDKAFCSLNRGVLYTRQRLRSKLLHACVGTQITTSYDPNTVPVKLEQLWDMYHSTLSQQFHNSCKEGAIVVLEELLNKMIVVLSMVWKSHLFSLSGPSS